MVVGDGRPHIGALITLDEEALQAWKRKVGKPTDADVASLCHDPDLLKELQSAIEEASRVVSRAESIRRFRVLDTDFSEAAGEVTPTLKLRRDVVLRTRAADIDALYAPPDAAPSQPSPRATPRH
jgi:long-chain acyl-CoA synthetase